MKYPRLTVDGIVIKNKKILLIKRNVEYGEPVEHAVVREVNEETGMTTTEHKLFGIYSEPGRDPRGHTVSVVFLLTVKTRKPKGGDDALEARFFGFNNLPPLAFDHEKIIKDVGDTQSHGM
jgi:8-oxo-dGTP diphosphatase